MLNKLSNDLVVLGDEIGLFLSGRGGTKDDFGLRFDEPGVNLILTISSYK